MTNYNNMSTVQWSIIRWSNVRWSKPLELTTSSTWCWYFVVYESRGIGNTILWVILILAQCLRQSATSVQRPFHSSRYVTCTEALKVLQRTGIRMLTAYSQKTIRFQLSLQSSSRFSLCNPISAEPLIACVLLRPRAQ